MAEDFTVDACVWIAEADVTDLFHEESSQFLAAAQVDGADSLPHRLSSWKSPACWHEKSKTQLKVDDSRRRRSSGIA